MAKDLKSLVDNGFLKRNNNGRWTTYEINESYEKGPLEGLSWDQVGIKSGPSWDQAKKVLLMLVPMSHENIIALLSILISAIVALAGFIIARQTEKLRTMREQLSEKKYKAYADAVKMFYSVLKDSKAHRATNSGVMMEKMIDIKRDIFMYGSDKVFRSFNRWLLEAKENNDKAQFSAFLDFVLEMRKDLCNAKTNLTKHDILLNLTQSEEEARKLYN